MHMSWWLLVIWLLHFEPLRCTQITFSAFDPQVWALEIQTQMSLLHNHMTPRAGVLWHCVAKIHNKSARCASASSFQERKAFPNFSFIITNVCFIFSYSYFNQLPLILQHFVLKLVSQFKYFMYLMLQQTGSKVGLELRAYMQVICSPPRLQLHPSTSRWEPPCPACVASHLVVMEEGSRLWLGVGERLRNIS